VIARETLMILQKNMTMVRFASREFQAQFREDARFIGETVNIRKPRDFVCLNA
jgi:hypothetical protein